ncbi:hypothetical protein RHMOL_Rhmol04G0228400 [Rhododendron molle]|uniref:Uncharacterized protein n=1 Tax=Rhododendron molle TaxID=49168 RepID=A0ACC0P4J7_RHOML|nr:hypothetical protein RHMOL_Rhmol04G0228400 [Rhododendron molle]
MQVEPVRNQSALVQPKSTNPTSSNGAQKKQSPKPNWASLKNAAHKHKGKEHSLHGVSQRSKPIFKPISGVSIDLNLANPNLPVIPQTSLPIQPPQSTQPSQPNPQIASPRHPSNKEPPDLTNLPTLTYHEFARNAESFSQLPQNANVARTGVKHLSPGRCDLVAGGLQPENQALQNLAGGDVLPQGGNQTAHATGTVPQ